MICLPCMFAQLCLTLCNPMDCCPLGSSVHRILQARILEWLPFPPPGDLPNPGIYQQLLDLLHCQADSLPMSNLGLWEAPRIPLDTYLLENAIGDVATYEQGYMKDVSPQFYSKIGLYSIKCVLIDLMFPTIQGFALLSF